jgi:hypothetical protein
VAMLLTFVFWFIVAIFSSTEERWKKKSFSSYSHTRAHQQWRHGPWFPFHANFSGSDHFACVQRIPISQMFIAIWTHGTVTVHSDFHSQFRSSNKNVWSWHKLNRSIDQAELYSLRLFLFLQLRPKCSSAKVSFFS